MAINEVDRIIWPNMDGAEQDLADTLELMQGFNTEEFLDRTVGIDENFGVCFGLALGANPSGAANVVRRGAGLAFDQSGRRIAPATFHNIAVVPADISKYIVIQRVPQESDPVDIILTGATPNRQETGVFVTSMTTTPSSNHVRLGKVTAVTGLGVITLSQTYSDRDLWSARLSGQSVYEQRVIKSQTYNDTAAPSTINHLANYLHQVAYEINRMKNTSLATGYQAPVTYPLDRGGPFTTQPSGMTFTQETVASMQTGALTTADKSAANEVLLKMDLTVDAVHASGVKSYRWKLVRQGAPADTPFQPWMEKFALSKSVSADPSASIVVEANVPVIVYVMAESWTGELTDWVTDHGQFTTGVSIGPGIGAPTVSSGEYSVLVTWNGIADARYELVYTTSVAGDPAEPDFTNVNHEKVPLGIDARRYVIKLDEDIHCRVKVRAVNDYGLAGTGREPAAYPDGPLNTYVIADGLDATSRSKLNAFADVPTDLDGQLSVDFNIISKLADSGAFHVGLSNTVRPSSIVYRSIYVADTFTVPGTLDLDAFEFIYQNIALRELYVTLTEPLVGALNLNPATDSLRIYSVLAAPPAGDLISIGLDDSAAAGSPFSDASSTTYANRSMVSAGTGITLDMVIATGVGGPIAFAMNIVMGYTLE